MYADDTTLILLGIYPGNEPRLHLPKSFARKSLKPVHLFELSWSQFLPMKSRQQSKRCRIKNESRYRFGLSPPLISAHSCTAFIYHYGKILRSTRRRTCFDLYFSNNKTDLIGSNIENLDIIFRKYAFYIAYLSVAFERK